MEKINKPWQAVIALLLFIVIGSAYFYFTWSRAKRIAQETEKSYVLVGKQSEIDGYVTSIYEPPMLRPNPYYINITISDSLRITIHAKADSSRNMIGHIVKVGSKIIKHRGSESITVINNGDKKQDYFNFTLWKTR